MDRRFGWISLGALAVLSFAACGKKNGADPVVGSPADAYPEGFAVAAPLAGEVPAFAGGDEEGPIYVNPGKSFGQKEAELNQLINGVTDADCEVVFGMLVAGGNPPCYGPMLYYKNHPDFGTTGDIPPPPGATTANGLLPGGDLGIWSATNVGSDEACTASKVNITVDDVSLRVDIGLYTAASMICLMNVHEVDLPGEGEEVDMTELLDPVLSSVNGDVGVTSAVIGRGDDLDGDPVYAYGVTMTVGSAGANQLSVEFDWLHTGDPDDTAYRGKIWGKVENLPMGPASTAAYSVLYERAQASIGYRLLSAGYPETATDIFAENGDLAVDGDWTGNMTQAIVNQAANESMFSVGWQAGPMDDSTRVFNAFVSNNDGCGFFGYGDKFDVVAGTAPDNLIKKFICNWAGVGNDHSGQASKAQKQCMSKTGGQFEPTSSLISYAPVNDCQANVGDTDSNDDDFSQGTYFGPLPDPTGTPPPSVVFSSAALPSQLVDLSTDTDYADFAPPSVPDDPF